MKKIFLPIIILSIISSCKKSSSPSGTAALNIIHATVNVDNIVANFTTAPIPYYQNQAFISFGSRAEYGMPSGNNPISIVSSGDTTKTLFSGTFNLSAGGIYSFYLAGQASHFDTLFMQDMIPIYVDSSAGVRFINLSPDSQPITINLAGNDPGQTEFTNLGYRQISSFKTYAANSNAGGSYNFEVRDLATQNLLTTFSWNYTLSKNNTLVISGLEVNGINIFQVNNY